MASRFITPAPGKRTGDAPARSAACCMRSAAVRQKMVLGKRLRKGNSGETHMMISKSRLADRNQSERRTYFLPPEKAQSALLFRKAFIR